MKSRPFASSRFLLLPALFVCAACASPTERAEGVARIDDLLAKIECVQVAAVVSKDAARSSLDQLEALCAPDFTGDAKQAYAHLLETIDHSVKQAQALHQSVEPMRESADSVFRQWTTDLGAFGNTRMRQRSQTRLDDTQARYRAVYATAQSALIGYEAFNADMRDHALFLGHDLNSAAIAELADDVVALKDTMRQLDTRLDACANAARAYVETAALHGQVEALPTERQVAEPKADPTKTEAATKDTQGSKHRGSTLKRRPTSPAQSEPAPQPAPTPSPAPTSDPAPAPEPEPGVAPPVPAPH